MRDRIIILLFIGIFNMINSFGQMNQQKIDSLSNVLDEINIHDTTKASVYLELVDHLYYQNMDTLRSMSQMALDLANKNLKFKKLSKGLKNKWFIISGAALSNIGSYYTTQGEMDKSIEYFKESIAFLEKSDAKMNLVTSYMNLGILFRVMGNLENAIDYFFKSLKVAESIKYYYGMGSANNLIGVVQAEQGNNDEAIIYYEKAKKNFVKSGDEQGIAQANANISQHKINIGKLEEAKVILEDNLRIYTKIENIYGISQTQIVLGKIYLKEGNIEKAEKYLIEAKLVIGDFYNPVAKASAYNAFAELEMLKGNYFKVIEYAEVGKTESITAQDIEALRTASDLLFNSYRKVGDFKNALEMHLLFTSLQDSVKGIELEKKLFQKETEFEYSQKKYKDSLVHAAENKIKKEELARQDAELSAQQNKLYAFIGGFILIVVFAIILFNRLKISQRQKRIIEDQKKEVVSQKEMLEEKNKEITDSINYAKRIQEAILPSRYSLTESLKNGFVLFQPKDIVSGDFYWLENIHGTVFFAAADCTGHGVPGAMVSVICSNALSKALLEENILLPGKLLDRTKELVIQRFEKSGEEVKDGMDISLCALNYETKKLQWAGANNPLWILRKGEILEIKADKQPVGKSPSDSPFTTHSIDLFANDIVYIFTDGYQDQFGGPKGKKFKANQLKEILIANKDLTMEKQKAFIIDQFQQWKGELEQVDDVCIIGVRI
jgi:serine phosphatase RsbU (regulator of sigma subunit)